MRKEKPASASKATQRQVLLILLYISFISLGLPDSILGAAWPDMRASFAKPLEHAGYLAAFITILSAGASFATGFFTARYSTGLIIAVSSGLTACAMFGYAAAPAWGILLFFTTFFGIGQGTVDTAVNAYMARHYSSRHMNWVHCCWGIGATGGPMIITLCFFMGQGWRTGYAAIGLLQLAACLLFSSTLGLWKAASAPAHAGGANETAHALQLSPPPAHLRVIRVAGGIFYLLYPGIEFIAGLWGASFLVEYRQAPQSLASLSLTLYWAALTAGRFLTGLLAHRRSAKTVIRCGLATALAGIALLYAAPSLPVCIAGLILLGAGISPLYPAMMHDAPKRVGLAHADKQIGLQVGSALAGSAVLPILTGLAAERLSLAVFAPSLFICASLVLAAHEVSARYAFPGTKGVGR